MVLDYADELQRWGLGGGSAEGSGEGLGGLAGEEAAGAIERDLGLVGQALLGDALVGVGDREGGLVDRCNVGRGLGGFDELDFKARQGHA